MGYNSHGYEYDRLAFTRLNWIVSPEQWHGRSYTHPPTLEIYIKSHHLSRESIFLSTFVIVWLVHILFVDNLCEWVPNMVERVTTEDETLALY
jgi:hypothetical protein